MVSTKIEERNLKKKLEELEKRYKQNLFSDSESSLPELPEIVSPEEPETPKEIYSETKEQQIYEPDKKKKFGLTFPFKKTERSLPNLPEPVPAEEINEKDLGEKKKIISPKSPKGPLNYKNYSNAGGLSGRISTIDIKNSAEKIQNLRTEVGKVLVGQQEIVDGLIRGLLCNSHVLVEGVPGIAKTLAIRSLAAASGCSVKRVQFTVDMLPTDIIGVTTYTPGKGFEVIKGPIFANFLIADEINRAPPKTQSALIEGMQEKQVTIGRDTFPLPNPFFVMATENPIENSGVYPLPEAQIDRFLFKLIMDYPESEEEKKIMDTNMTIKKFEEYDLKPVVNPKEIIKMQDIVKRVYLDENIKDYILSIVRKTRQRDFENAKYIAYGCSPRASIGLFIASKANALMNGRDYVLPEDVRKIAPEVLRHRLILSYKASIQKISSDLIVKEILDSISIE
ncbi:MAG: MoxR family ATPase [Candidatus Pacearchaeota archaeon]